MSRIVGKKGGIIMNTLLDGLLLGFKSKKGLFKYCTNRDDLVELVFPFFDIYSGKRTPLSRPEIYNVSAECDFRNNKNCYSYIFDENSVSDVLDGKTWRQIRLDTIHKFILSCQREGALADLKDILMELLEKTDIHDGKLTEKMLFSISRLKSFNGVGLLDEKSLDNWKNAIYYYFYFAVTDKLHSDMAFSLYPELERDLDEYNQKVTMMYGVSGNPGMYQLYALANRSKPNILALYECGELEYYGKGPSGKINYDKAYEYYELTKECNKEHPLATWSIAYMRFHYDQKLASEKPEYRVQQFEDELKNGKKNSWYEAILYNAETSYNNSCSAAANLLGQIIDSSDEEFPMSKRGKFKNRDSIDLYKESADAGYVFGCNNYAQACLKKAEKSEGIEKFDLYKEAVKYLDKSAQLGNPWAANKMGLYYVHGFNVGQDVIVQKDVNLAYERFKYATVMSNAELYYWPLINICEYYWLNPESEKYKENVEQIKLLLRDALDKLQGRDEAQSEHIRKCMELLKR